MDKITTPASYVTSGTMTILGSMTINEYMAVIGIILGIATFVVNWFYKHKQFKQAQKSREADK